jgi:hypothetical protein
MRSWERRKQSRQRGGLRCRRSLQVMRSRAGEEGEERGRSRPKIHSALRACWKFLLDVGVIVWVRSRKQPPFAQPEGGCVRDGLRRTAYGRYASAVHTTPLLRPQKGMDDTREGGVHKTNTVGLVVPALAERTILFSIKRNGVLFLVIIMVKNGVQVCCCRLPVWIIVSSFKPPIVPITIPRI